MNRPILTQDEVQRNKPTKEWLFTKYDAFGRVVYTGVYRDNKTRSQVQTSAKANAGQYEIKGTDFSQFYDYTNSTYPININSNDIYTVNYYGNYDFDMDGLSIPSDVYGIATTNNVNNLPTGIKERVMDANNNPTSHWGTTITSVKKHLK